MTEEIKNWEDPIVKEVRAVRDAHAQKFGYDLKAVFEDHRRIAEQLRETGYRLVSRPAKRTEGKAGTI